MNVETLKETFFTLVSPDMPNEWDVEEAVESLAAMDELTCRAALNQVPVIWPVSHSLCFDYLKAVASALDCFEPGNLSEWVNSTLDRYEKHGLRAAQRYMDDVEGNFLCPLRGENGVSFKQISGRMLPYLRGLSGKPLDIAPHEVVHTDTATIYLPHEMTWFTDDADNLFMYKLMLTYQWAYIACSSYLVCDVAGTRPEQNGSPGTLWLQGFLDSFPDPRLAGDLYHLLETIRVTAFLEKELPGLMRRKESLPERQQSGNVLSDGKPEDYDDYKGEYAIEDTRHALIEAKAVGIHPFCITVDRHAQEYMGHMYGSVNYIQIDDVKKLPRKMPEIYRILTN